MSQKCWCGQELLLRDPLPTRRFGESLSFQHRGLHFNATVGRRTSGEIAEVFLNIAPTRGGKYGSDGDLSARDAAVAVSLALQHGVSLETLERAMGKELDGSPSTPIGKLLEILMQDQKESADAQQQGKD